MILLAAIVGGLLAGWGIARWQKRSYRVPELRAGWLAVLAFVPQLLIAYLPGPRSLFAGWPAALALWASMGIFLVFVWINRTVPGILVLLAGLLLNALVMAANGGWMPIDAQTASRLQGADVTTYLAWGSRFGQKDILLPAQGIRLAFLADRILLPEWTGYRAAFSFGDILIAAGAFWVLARPRHPITDRTLE